MNVTDSEHKYPNNTLGEGMALEEVKTESKIDMKRSTPPSNEDGVDFKRMRHEKTELVAATIQRHQELLKSDEERSLSAIGQIQTPAGYLVMPCPAKGMAGDHNGQVSRFNAGRVNRTLCH